MMQETKHKFYELADELLHENGLLANRPSWIKLRQLVHDAPPDFLENDCRSPVYSILLVLVSTHEKSDERQKKLSAIFDKVCHNAPDELFICILKELSSEDLKTTLLPRIYSADLRGSVAVYLAARIGLHVDAEAFQYFLTARTWGQTDLINLVFLVRPVEQITVSTILERATKSESSAVTREIYTEFRHLLFVPQPERPLLPDILPVVDSLSNQRHDNIESEPETGATIRPGPQAIQVKQPFIPQASEVVDAVTAKSDETLKTPRPAFNYSRPKSSQAKDNRNEPRSAELLTAFTLLIERNQTALVVLFVITTIFLLSTGLSSWMMSGSETNIRTADSGKIPSHWVDSTTREKITERYLAADKDYRMGELYLTRDRYSEALILFEDALAIKPDHTQALYRVGYCRLNIKDYAGAKTALAKALDIDPNFRHANLLLARAAAAQLDNQTAESHFNKELELAKDPSVAEEYANFLHSTGKQTEAENLINKYQALYPDRILILTRKPEKPENQEQRQ